MASVEQEIKSANSKAFRRAFVKRRLASTGLFESDWQEITEDIKKYGKISKQSDITKPGRFRFSGAKLTVANDEGKYNPETDDNSLWSGFGRQQRSLVKIEAGFTAQTLSAGGIWTNFEIPGENTFWDEGLFDESLFGGEDPGVFVGILWGDIPVSSKNEVVLNVQPLTKIFQDFAAENLTGFTSTGLTASQFMEIVRDQEDASGSKIFLPFFDNTTTTWNIETTNNVYADLNTSSSTKIIDKNVWQVMEDLAAAENNIIHIKGDGTFNFVRKDSETGTSFEFHGSGSVSGTYGQTIKTIKSFGPKVTKFYSRVQVKYKEENTTTSFETIESTLTVANGNLAWELGQRTLNINNTFIGTSTVANSLATTLFNDLSSLKREMKFPTSFISHLNLLDKVTVTYDSSGQAQPESLWDLNDWADTAGAALTGDELEWDATAGDAIKLNQEEFRIISIDLDLDKLETNFILRET